MNIRNFKAVGGAIKFSTHTLKDTEKGKESFRVDSEIIRKIKSDLISSDVNKDGRVDADEIKLILKKYSDAFSDEDVVKIRELFYVGKAGGSVSHETFLEAVKAASSSDEIDESGLFHRRTKNVEHPLGLGSCGAEFMYGSRGVYTPEQLDVKLTHVQPITMTDKLAHAAVRVIRLCFDIVSGWRFGEISKDKIFRRVIFLETVAAIPGFIAAMVRHFKSLRHMDRDGGMLNMFLDEANNERMHLLTFVRMRDPPSILKYVVLVSQTVIGAAFFILYHISSDFCHRMVGYIEEEACHTYTDIINAIENAPEGSELASWRTELAPKIAIGYWHLGANGTVLDLFYAVRADEAEHRDVNHTVTGLKEGQLSPLYNPDAEFDKVLKQYVNEMMKK